jgi:Carbamoylphosphate synthase large subunit (split gene in MJ)
VPCLPRLVFEELGLPVPAYFHAVTLQEAQEGIAKIGYPVVIKPTDAFASRGVFKVYNENELVEYFPRSLQASRSKNIIVEQFLQGDQYFCQGFVQEHKLRLYAFSDRYYYDLPDVAIPYTNAFPAKISRALQDRMTEMFTKVVEYLNPLFGHVWAEWIYNKETDKLYIIEIAIRGGGAFVTDELIPRAYGIDSQPYLVNAAMGHNERKFANEVIKQRSAAFFSFLLPEGKIIKIEGLENVEGIPGVVKTDFKKMAVGDIVPPIENKGSRYGMVIIEGKDRDELDAVLCVVKQTLTINVDTINGEKGIIWD